jgi:hypothetical protein
VPWRRRSGTRGWVDIVTSRESPAAIAQLVLLLLPIYERFTRQTFGSFYSLLLSLPFRLEVVSYIGLPLSSGIGCSMLISFYGDPTDPLLGRDVRDPRSATGTSLDPAPTYIYTKD